jgi:hypothetical protein
MRWKNSWKRQSPRPPKVEREVGALDMVIIYTTPT